MICFSALLHMKELYLKPRKYNTSPKGSGFQKVYTDTAIKILSLVRFQSTEWESLCCTDGRADRIRTCNLRIWSPLLYQLELLPFYLFLQIILTT